jgi:hypothetical protein
MTSRIVLAAGLSLVLATLTLGAAGCQSVTEKAVEEATGVKVDEDEDSVTIESEDGDGESVTISGEEGSVPEDFPDDVPLYDATVVGSSSYESGENVNYSVTLETKDSVEDVAAFYEEELESEGWEIEGTFNTATDEEAATMISAVKGTGRTVIINASQSDGVTDVVVNVNNEG